MLSEILIFHQLFDLIRTQIYHVVHLLHGHLESFHLKKYGSVICFRQSKDVHRDPPSDSPVYLLPTVHEAEEDTKAKRARLPVRKTQPKAMTLRSKFKIKKREPIPW